MPKPGDVVQMSGIYRVTHDNNHTQPHDVTCVAGKKFPRCRGCEEPQFTLANPAQHVETHRLFKKKKVT
jgi:hypothetical protein